jgi:hypothetical protein
MSAPRLETNLLLQAGRLLLQYNELIRLRGGKRYHARSGVF